MKLWIHTAVLAVTALACAGFEVHRFNIVQRQIVDLNFQMNRVIVAYDHAAGQPWRTDRMLEDSAINGPGVSVLSGDQVLICPQKQ